MHFETPAHPHHPLPRDPNPQVSDAARALTEHGLNEADAVEWVALDLPRSADLIRRSLTADRCGLSPAAYTVWSGIGDWSPGDANAFLRSGFSHAEAVFARALLTHAAVKRGADATALTAAWLDCPLSPAWICRALALGITRPDTASALFARAVNEPALLVTLDGTADLRGANNRELRIDHARLQRMGVQPPAPPHRGTHHRRTTPPRPHSAHLLWAVDDSAEPD